MAQDAILSKKFLSRAPTEITYFEGSVFITDVYTENFWTFHLGVESRVIVPIFVIVGFEERID